MNDINLSEKKISTKKFFINYAIFTGILLALMSILIYFMRISRASWKNNLKSSMEIVLNEYRPNEWTVGQALQINNPKSLNSVCYECRNRKTGEVYYAILTRIITFYGNCGAVFMYPLETPNDGTKKTVEFIGYLSLHGRVNKLLSSQKENDKRIKYISERIPTIIENNVTGGVK